MLSRPMISFVFYCCTVFCLLFSIDLHGQFGLDSLHGVIDNQQVYQLFAEDIDQDNDVDIMIGSAGFNGGVSLYENTDGNGNFLLKQFSGGRSYFYGDNSLYYAFGDLDNDGDLDIIGDQEALDAETPFWENDGAGNFTTTDFFPDYMPPTDIDQIEIIDSDGDNLNEIWLKSRYEILFKTPQLDGSFVATTIAVTETSTEYLYNFVLIDTDQDGDLDLIFHKRDWNNDFTYRMKYEQTAPHVFALTEMEEIEEWANGFSISPKLFAADFNQDGWVDYALLAHLYESDKIVQVYQNQNGVFSLTQTYFDYDKISLSDFNTDGQIDIIGIKATEENNVFAWLSNDDNFNFTENISTEEMHGFHLISKDFNGDNLQDITSLSGQNSVNQAATVNWQAGLADLGTFGTPQEVSYHLADVFLVHADDPDNDNDLDLFVLDHTTPGNARISYFENEDGQGNYGLKQNLGDVDHESRYALFHDFNGDNIPDLLSSETTPIVDNQLFYYLTYYPSNTDLSYSGGVRLSETPTGYEKPMAILDIDNDGFDDIISITHEPKISAFFYNPADDSFSESTDFLPTPPHDESGAFPVYLHAFDPDQDGDMDLIIGTIKKVYWAENMDGSGTFSEWQVLDNSFDRVNSFQSGDVEGDGDIDLMATGFIGNSHLNDERYFLLFRFDAPSQTFSSPEPYLPEQYFHDYLFDDFSQDGFPDLLSSHGFQTNLVPTGTFAPRRLPSPIGGTYPMSKESKIIFADVDGDGEVELVRGQNELLWFNLDWVNAANINGRVVIDASNNCLTDESLPPFTNLPILINQIDGNDDQLINTTAEGLFAALILENGTYEVAPILPNAYWQVCPESAILNIENEDDFLETNFSIIPLVDCPLMQMELSNSFTRLCFNTTLQISYHNEGTATADDAQIILNIPSGLELISSSLMPLMVNDSTLQFDLGDVEIFETGTIDLVFYVDCDEFELGDVICFDAQITPNELCDPGNSVQWDGSSLQGSSFCVNEEQIAFRVANIGDGAMAAPQTYQVSIVNDDLILFLADDVLLPPGEADTIYLPQPMAGENWLFQINQSPGHPNPVPIALTNAVCDEASNAFNNGVPNMDGYVFEELLCREVIGAYDPNNKIGRPQGLGAMHFIEKDWTIDYTINFQNTGTDTAFLVVLKDDISPLLDLNTFAMKNASHPFFWNIHNRELAITFPNILLPDSTANEPASKGFVNFSIAPNKDILPLSQIENTAGIYFDYNEPVITNTAVHTIIKPIHSAVSHTAFCAGESYAGVPIWSDTIVQEFIPGIEYDSIHWVHIDVFDMPNTVFEVTLNEAGVWENIQINMDTSIVQTFVSQEGCDSLVTFNITVLTNVKEPEWKAAITVGPNPTSEQLFINWVQLPASEFIQLKVINSLGREVYQKQISATENHFTFERNNLPAGHYYVEITVNNQSAQWAVVFL